jgi:hypothetical protein
MPEEKLTVSEIIARILLYRGLKELSEKDQCPPPEETFPEFYTPGKTLVFRDGSWYNVW